MILINLLPKNNSLNFIINIRYLGKTLVGIGQCNKCQKVKNAEKFHSKKECLACYHKKHRANNKSYLKTQKTRRANRTEEEKNKDKQRHSNWNILNKEARRIYKNEYRKANPLSRKGENQFRERQIDLQLIAKANRKQIKEIYKSCPNGMQVDHIIPILHKDVCGLHVPWNMQYLSPFENNLKNNHWDGTLDNKSWKK